MRLIDADKLHYHRVWIASIKKSEYNGMKSAVVVFADEIDKNKKARVDAADVAPVRHGRWFYSFGGWLCSECDDQAPFWCMASTQNLSNYCPNCGAKMDGGADDADS